MSDQNSQDQGATTLEKAKKELEEAEGKLKTAEDNLTKSKDKLEQTEKDLANLRKRQSSLRSALRRQKVWRFISQLINRSALKRLDRRILALKRIQARLSSKIRDTQVSKNTAEATVKSDTETLSQAKKDTTDGAKKLIRYAVYSWLKKIGNIFINHILSSTSVGYLGIAGIGFLYERSFYKKFDINVSGYFQASDFLLPNFQILSVLCDFLLFVIALIVLSFIPFFQLRHDRGLVEIAKRCYRRATKLSTTLSIVLIAFVLCVPAAFYRASANVDKILNKTNNVLTLVASSPLEGCYKPEQIGSNSTYVFFYCGSSEGSTNVMIIPQNSIVWTIGENQDRSPVTTLTVFEGAILKELEDGIGLGDVTISLDKNPWISELIQKIRTIQVLDTERWMKKEIASIISCSESDLIVSGPLLFRVNETELDEKDLKMTRNEVTQFLQEVPGGNLYVVGFASDDGNQADNKQLSCERAITVKKLYKDEFKLNTKVLPIGLDENHFTNGVANSRSARFAACRSQAGSTQPTLGPQDLNLCEDVYKPENDMTDPK